MDTKENAGNVGIGFEPPAGQELRRPPRPPLGDLADILVVQDPEAPLKSERVEEWLQALPEWQVTLDGQGITRAKDLLAPEVASLYPAYVTGFAGHLGLPVAVGVLGGMVRVTVYGPACGDYLGGLTESMFDFAHQIG